MRPQTVQSIKNGYLKYNFFNMLKWNKVTPYSQGLALLLGIIIFIGGFYLGSARSDKSLNQSDLTTGVTLGDLDAKSAIPVLDLPLKYFPKESFRGSNGVSDDMYEMESANIDAGYQSFPTTTISISSRGYSNDVENLPVIKSKEVILADSDIYTDTFNEQLNEYGDFAKRFLPEYTITEIKKFDVDNDGKDEYIIGVCDLGGNHCPQKIVIVKDDKIIFSTVAGVSNPEIVETGTSNGFYIVWVPSADTGAKWDVGLCCSIGYIKTRFAFEGLRFVPVYEQEVLYINVRNTK